MAKTRLEVRLAGSGGQGVVLAGVILAEAAAGSGLWVSQFQAYGPASRGGASWTDVIISREPVRYPKADVLDVLVALTQAACDSSLHELRAGGLLLLDSGQVKNPAAAGLDCRSLPIGKSAEEAGSRLSANVVALGALNAATDAVPLDRLESAVAAHVPAASRELNLRALSLGRRLLEASRETRAS